MLNNLIKLNAAIFFLFISWGYKPDSCPQLKYDGIYTFKIDNENSAVIRFYDDHTVLVSTSVNDYSKVMTWFNRDPENYSRVLTGKYLIHSKSCGLSFTVSGETGKQIYKGSISSTKKLELHITNSETKAHTVRTYTFVHP